MPLSLMTYLSFCKAGKHKQAQFVTYDVTRLDCEKLSGLPTNEQGMQS